MIETIAWKALSISLRRIERACLCTKICNDLLPTARILYRWNQQGHDSCSLCGREETTNHMILCHHPSRLKLRRKYITTIRARLHRVNTRVGLIDTFCSAISDWFDDGTVDLSKYPTNTIKRYNSNQKSDGITSTRAISQQRGLRSKSLPAQPPDWPKLVICGHP